MAIPQETIGEITGEVLRSSQNMFSLASNDPFCERRLIWSFDCARFFLTLYIRVLVCVLVSGE